LLHAISGSLPTINWWWCNITACLIKLMGLNASAWSGLIHRHQHDRGVPDVEKVQV